MPANKKHFSTTGQRVLKISAGLLGGYGVSLSFFIALYSLTNFSGVLYTFLFGGFLLWAALLVCAFIFKNGWKAWGLYLLLCLIFSGLAFVL